MAAHSTFCPVTQAAHQNHPVELIDIKSSYNKIESSIFHTYDLMYYHSTDVATTGCIPVPINGADERCISAKASNLIVAFFNAEDHLLRVLQLWR
jgi:hypothetical protein